MWNIIAYTVSKLPFGIKVLRKYSVIFIGQITTAAYNSPTEYDSSQKYNISDVSCV
jgi:hypothetical protein